MSDLQRLKNECGRLTRINTDLVAQRRDMQADLVGQREDMRLAIEALDQGELRRARKILSDSLAAWERKRAPRKGKVA